MRRPLVALLMVTLALVAFPEAAAACPVCFDARDENRQAFLATTAFLTLLPLGLLGGVGMWLRRRMREVEQEGEEE